MMQPAVHHRQKREGQLCTVVTGVNSPLLSNIYLYYMLDLWFSHNVRRQCRGEAYYFRFADDFLACFQYRDNASVFLEQLAERLKKFGLTLAAEKTRCIEFGRFARNQTYKRGGKPQEFTFLGFTHYCGKTKEGYFKVKRRTSRRKLEQSLHNFGDWARRARHRLSKGEMLRQAKIRIVGHLNYYAITDNSEHCNNYVFYATPLLFKWLNRKCKPLSLRHSTRDCKRTSHTYGLRPSRLRVEDAVSRRHHAHRDVLRRCPSRLFRLQGSRGVYIRAEHMSLPPCASDILAVRFRAIDGRGLSPH